MEEKERGGGERSEEREGEEGGKEAKGGREATANVAAVPASGGGREGGTEEGGREGERSAEGKDAVLKALLDSEGGPKSAVPQTGEGGKELAGAEKPAAT